MNLQKKHQLVLILGILLVSLVIANGFVYFFRVDLSSARSYTISKASRDLLTQLDAPVEVTYYLSGALKSKDPTFQQIEDVLYEYALASKGQLNLKLVDPSTPAKENEVAELGIQPKNLSVVDNAQVSQTRVYSGLLIRYLDKQKIIPFIASSEVLEYELGVQILQITRDKNLVLALVNGGSGQDILGQYTLVQNELSKLYDVRLVNAGEDIPLDADVLFVFKAEGIDKKQAIAIERFILSGKGVLIGAETYGINLQYGLMPDGPRTDSEILKMLSHYGITVGQSLVLDVYNKDFPVTRQQGQVQYQEMVPYPYWINLANEEGNSSHPVANGIESLDLLWTSPITIREGVEAEVLFNSTPKSMLAEGQINLNPEQAEFLMAMTQSETAARPLVVSRTGKLDSYYAANEAEAKLPASSDNARLLVVGDSDFASDLIQYSDSGANMQFILNSLIWLGNDPALLALKARKPASPALSAIKDAGARARIETFAIIVNAVLIPLAVAVFGIVRLVQRRRYKKS